jgi:hypothetical protein
MMWSERNYPIITLKDDINPSGPADVAQHVHIK